MGTVTDGFVAAFAAGPVDKAAARALGATIEAYIGALTLFDFAGAPPVPASGDAGKIVVVNATEDGTEYAAAP